MSEAVLIRVVARLVEVIHVELPNEGVHVTVPEENGENSFFEVLLVQAVPAVRDERRLVQERTTRAA